MPKIWYVNLPEDPRQCAGPKLPLTATRAVVSKHDVTRSVTWRCVGDQQNLNTVPEHASWEKGDQPGTQSSAVREDGKTRKFHNTLVLPPYGGDKYTIAAQRSDKTGPMLTETVETRRKLYYVTNWMDPEGKQLLKLVEPEIARIFGELGVELQRVGEAKIKSQPDVTSDGLKTLVGKHPSLESIKVGVGQMMRLVLAQRLGATEQHRLTLPVEIGFGKNDEGEVKLVNGVWQITACLPPDGDRPLHRRPRFPSEPKVTVAVDEYNCFTNKVRSSFDKITDLLCDVKRVDDRTVLITIRDGKMPNNAALTKLAGLYAESVKLHFGKDEVPYPRDTFDDEPNPERPKLSFAVTLNIMRPIGGQSTGPNIALAADVSHIYPNAGRPQRGAALARIFAHEIAHAIGMVPTTVKLNGGNVAHAAHYTKVHGGVGPHCHTNARLEMNEQGLAGEFYFPDNPECVQVYIPDGEVCIMYHQRTNRFHAVEFCDECKKFIRALDLSRDALKKSDARWSQLY